jgi:hypothetical protein
MPVFIEYIDPLAWDSGLAAVVQIAKKMAGLFATGF